MTRVNVPRTTKSEFPPESALRHIEECEWRGLFRYGEEKAVEKGIAPEDVAGLVEEYRAEARASRT